MTGYFLYAFVYLVAAVIAVPIAKRLGLGSVLGYLIAGLVIGPIFGLVCNDAIFSWFRARASFSVGHEIETFGPWRPAANVNHCAYNRYRTGAGAAVWYITHYRPYFRSFFNRDCTANLTRERASEI